MAYNKAREEKKWRLWKEAEEKQLRSLGVSENDIEKLRVHDWAILLQIQGYSIAEIAAILGMKEDTVYKRLGRLKQKIKKLLG